jgi:hypothetical protein
MEEGGAGGVAEDDATAAAVMTPTGFLGRRGGSSASRSANRAST